MADLSNNLLKFRTRAGASQQTVATYLGITRQAYSYYENGTRRPPYETLLKLAAFYRVRVGELVGEQVQNDTRVSDDDIKFALFGGDGDITDEMYEEVRSFAQFVRERERRKKE